MLSIESQPIKYIIRGSECASRGTIKLFIGCMFAGKTTRMMWELQERVREGKKCALIVHNSDNRYPSPENTLKTHDGVVYSGFDKFIVSSLHDQDLYIKLLGYDFVAIDEIQFFEDGPVMCQSLTKMGVNVLCAGLSSNWLMKPFPVVSEMVAISDKIVKLRATCSCCKLKASFTAKIISSLKDTEKDKIIDIGGSEKFMAVCRKCHEKSMLAIG